MKKDRYESKHQLLTKKYEETGIQHFKDPIQLSLNVQVI